MGAKQFVDDAIASNLVVMFSKTWCGFCAMAKRALKDVGLKNFHLIELDGRNDGDQIQDYLKSITGSRTVRF